MCIKMANLVLCGIGLIQTVITLPMTTQAVQENINRYHYGKKGTFSTGTITENNKYL
jgi:hypothetical protein